ncbi:uncharacterized protein LOC109824977 isoform X1 [Asparagus officinalis]|uniref:uncharacterized protein LOC109824977 isoform X1 n=1 Tax=Asparagus officinalis TaxID=4686 RepID=UPI00098E3006|nr:uncharacterized protein LOC109824977 isoform X1 [Asparagus officinalis]
MDYDEIDFQSQNFQLVGEENKFPPSLRSFPLPKFDFDEHLQVHLRFDSLAETDVLLGIQGQDNNWIEDFSSGTSAIEFSSSAADNCSISRHNNVWSEATSSESVEMLLRSVGEDEMRDKKVEAMEADAQNVVNEMIDQMDPASRQVDDHSTVVGDIIKSPVLSPDKFQRNLSGASEISGAKSDASSLGDKFHTNRKSGGGQCMEADNVSQSSDDTSKNGSVISESLCNSVHNVEPLGTGSMKAYDARCWDASKVARRSPDTIACRVTQEKLVEKHTVINMTERSDLHVDDAQNEISPMSRDPAGNEQFLESHGVESQLCSRGNTSIVQPTRDSFVLMSERYNMSGYSEKPDGLLEAITYQVKAKKFDNKTGDRSSMPANEVISLENAGERSIEKDYVDISKENIPSQRTDHDEKGIGHTSEAAVEANASTRMNSETQRTETKDENMLQVNNLGAQTPDPVFVQKNVEAAVVKDVEGSGCKFIASENVMLDESPLPAVLNNPDVKISSPVPGKIHKMTEQSDVHTFSLESSAGQRYVGPSMSPGTTNLNGDDLVVLGKAKFATSSGQNSDNVGIASVSRAKHLVHDESAASKTAPMAVGLPSIVAEESKQVTSPKLLEPDSIYSDVKEVKITGTVSVSVLKCKSDALLPVVPVVTSDSVVTDSSLARDMAPDVPVPGVKVAVLDETIQLHQSEDTSTADTVPERYEGAASVQFSSEFIPSNDKEDKTSAVTSLTKSEGNVDNTPLTESNIGEHSPLRSIDNRQPALVDQPLSYVEASIPCQRLQSLVDKTIIHEEATSVVENLVVHDPPVERKDPSNKSEASSHENEETVSAKMTSHGEGRMLPETPSVEKNSVTLVKAGVNASTTLSESNGKAQLTVETVKGHAQNEQEVGNAKQVEHTTSDLKKSIASEDDRTFTFEVQRAEELSGNSIGDQWKPFTIMQSPELSEGCRSEHVEGKRRSRSRKTTSEDKPTHATKSSNEKQTTSKGRPAKRTSVRKKSTDSVGKSCATSSAPVGTVGSGMQLEAVQLFTESNHKKSSASPIVQPAGMPESNSSASSTTLVQQPFTDLQQLQLRAQIFAYGSLIQSIPPDEACMQSAFGATDAGRSSWESVWRKSVERYQTQKSPVNPETPLDSHSAAGAPKQVTKRSSRQSKAVSASSSRSVGKVIAPAVLSSTPPLPSPLWSVSTHDGLPCNLPRGAKLDFSQALSPLHSYPSSQKRQFTSSSMPWLPLNPRPGPWAVSAQSPTLNAATQYSTKLVVETLQVTAAKELSMGHAASVQLVSPSTLLPTPCSTSVPPASFVQLETQKQSASPGSNKKASSIQKPRKMKKVVATEDFTEIIPVSQSSMEPACTTTVSKTLPSASPGLLLSAIQPASAPNVPKTLPSASERLPLYNYTPPKVASQPIVSAATHISPPQNQVIVSANAEQRVIVSEETGNKIEQAKRQAEDAAVVAASVVSHSKTIWNQLAAQRNSGLVTEVEEKLASAAAKLASNAALQAKMMADEALDSAKTRSLAHSSEAIFDAEKNFARLSPGSILNGKDKVHGSSSIISAAREATRRRVEAASAATKRAENLDAIMKAAELAAEAVCQVGTIIAMGDPLPIKLSELVEAGSDCSWKANCPTSEMPNIANKLPEEEQKDLGHKGHDHVQTPSNKVNAVEDETFHDEQPIQSAVKCKVGLTGLGSGVGNPSTLLNDSHERNQSSGNLKENAIQKGSVVEVMSDKEGLRGGWFSARVLDLKDNEAYVCYSNLLSDDGSGQLKEWVSLDSERNRAPRIRIMHSVVSTKYDGTRKRRREAVGNYVWAVGDRVDARMHDGWFEGTVIEKSQVDETKLTVQFSAGGHSSLVRAWDLRPSLTWKDGQWIEWSRARDNTAQSYKGDTPHVKRPKLSRVDTKVDAEVDGTGISNFFEKMPAEFLGKAEETGPLNLSAKDTIFSVGENASGANISDALKGKRTGLRKEGSGVVFGVPKPGKKRKFMEVSKHYGSDKTNKTSQGADSLKFAKYLMPQTSRPWRNTSKVDSKVKQGGDSKSIGVKSIKSQTTQTRTTSEKENLSLTTASNGDKNGHGSSSNMTPGFSKEENNLEKNSLEAVSFLNSLQTNESLVPSSVSSLSTVRASKKKSSAVEAEQRVKGRPTPLDKSIRNEKKPTENHGTSFADAVEPRRSNRRIQPTSRLLEGLESSLTISKIPIFSHDKSSKALHKGSRGNTRG